MSLLSAKQAADFLGISKRMFLSLKIPSEGKPAQWSQQAIDSYLHERYQALPRKQQLRVGQAAELGLNPRLDDMLDMNSISYSQKAMPYTGPAVYFLFHQCRLVYIGKTFNMMRRVASHAPHKQFDSYAYIECSLDDLSELERRAIVKYQPPLNKI